ncbi:carboxylesterase family protein [Herbiconiux sp. CPCC 205716]|uniref:Carboxylesterase family protein n=1 Tax=Herbiconiux gentiana TaxID=2970912 RepID=A0ABT2GNK4_9MICO|nr:carboxylesterase family protein [Herbiconiux gentiana]MCS5716311.1 carboxylesterase family protein [Herbiconiux gentiana]
MTVFEPPCGPVEGRRDGDVVRVQGVPYAWAARIARPMPFEAWTEVRPAVERAPACPQPQNAFLDEVLGTRWGELPADEHCQRLTITLPGDLAEGEQVPVMVWIHGGSYTSGAGDLAIMDPAPLVREQRVIVVAVTYRLGLFGYLASGERPANLGLLDQLEAFRWVQRNIAAFGGDPGRVTAFGESAGGDAVAHLMTLPEAPRLFGRAIIQSAPLGISRGRARMSDAMGRVASAVTPTMPADEVVALQEQVAAPARRHGLLAGMPFGTQYGHDPLPPEPLVEAAWRAAAPSIEVLIGTTAEEARLFVARVPAVKVLAGLPLVGRFVQRMLVALVTRIVYGRPAAVFARRHARAGGVAHRYVISWAAPGNPYGACHTIDLPLLFGSWDTWSRAALVAGATPASLATAGRAVRQAWGNFAHGRLPAAGAVPGAVRHWRL